MSFIQERKKELNLLNKKKQKCLRFQCENRFISRKNKKYCSSYCRFKIWAIEHPRVKIEN